MAAYKQPLAKSRKGTLRREKCDSHWPPYAEDSCLVTVDGRRGHEHDSVPLALARELVRVKLPSGYVSNYDAGALFQPIDAHLVIGVLFHKLHNPITQSTE